MTYSRAMSPPPPCPSPQLNPTPLPSPPTLRVSRRRGQRSSPRSSPPISPRLLGSPLLIKTINTSRSYERINAEAKATLWVDGDEFGSDRADKEQMTPRPSPNTTPRKRAVRRCPSVHTAYHSPPPSPTISSPPPPVPPIPAFALSASDKKPVLHTPPPLPTWPAKIIPEYSLECAERVMMRRKRGLSAPSGRAGMTCSQFLAMHNPHRSAGGIIV